MITEPTIHYDPDTDTMAIELRPWPEGREGDKTQIAAKTPVRILLFITPPTGSHGCGRSSTLRCTPSISLRHWRRSGSELWRPPEPSSGLRERGYPRSFRCAAAWSCIDLRRRASGVGAQFV